MGRKVAQLKSSTHRRRSVVNRSKTLRNQALPHSVKGDSGEGGIRTRG